MTDRTPESRDIGWYSCPGYGYKFLDRPPGEVETVCRAWWPNHWPNVPNAENERQRARTALAALDAVRGRSRDDTVALSEVLGYFDTLRDAARGKGQDDLATELAYWRGVFEARFDAGRAGEE